MKVFDSLSVIIPVYNEEGNVEPLLNHLYPALQRTAIPFEIIFVDDGSIDGTFERLVKAKTCIPELRILNLAVNSGKSKAYRAGFINAKGTVIVTMDGDLQDDPDDLEKLLTAYEEGADLVIGHKVNDNGGSKAWSSFIFNKIMAFLFKVPFHDTNCPFRVMTAACARSLDLHGDNYRFIPVMAQMKNMRVTEIPVRNNMRFSGSSKYSWRKFLGGILDIGTFLFVRKFREKPVHFFGTIGILFILAGSSIDLVLVVRGLFVTGVISHFALLLFGVSLILAGVQISGIGLIGELITNHQKNDDVPITEFISQEKEELDKIHCTAF